MQNLTEHTAIRKIGEIQMIFSQILERPFHGRAQITLQEPLRGCAGSALSVSFGEANQLTGVYRGLLAPYS